MSTGARKPLEKRNPQRGKIEADIVRHAKFIKSDAPPSEALLHKLRDRIKAEGGTKEYEQQMPRSRREEACEAQRPNKVRRIDEACAECPKSFGQTGSRNEGHTRSTFSSSLSQKIKDQASRIVTMHYFKNSQSETARASMRHQYVHHGMGCDQRTLQGSTSRSSLGKKCNEDEAIGRLLNIKSH